MVGRIRFALERLPSPRHRSHVAQLFSLGHESHLLSMTTQNIAQEDRTRIRVVADAMRRRAAEPEIIAALVGTGVSHEVAGEFYRVVAHGLRAGVSAGVTGGLSAQQHQRGESLLWDAAFDEGQRQFGGAVSGVWFRRLAWLLIPIVALVIWLLLR